MKCIKTFKILTVAIAIILFMTSQSFGSARQEACAPQDAFSHNFLNIKQTTGAHDLNKKEYRHHDRTPLDNHCSMVVCANPIGDSQIARNQIAKKELSYSKKIRDESVYFSLRRKQQFFTLTYLNHNPLPYKIRLHLFFKRLLI